MKKENQFTDPLIDRKKKITVFLVVASFLGVSFVDLLYPVDSPQYPAILVTIALAIFVSGLVYLLISVAGKIMLVFAKAAVTEYKEQNRRLKKIYWLKVLAIIFALLIFFVIAFSWIFPWLETHSWYWVVFPLLAPLWWLVRLGWLPDLMDYYNRLTSRSDEKR